LIRRKSGNNELEASRKKLAAALTKGADELNFETAAVPATQARS
jgi:hypothetical protein